MTWIPLHVHSQFSILNATASIYALVAKAKQYEIPALALTDQGNLYGVIDFFKACVGASIKPIIGCELYVAPFSRFEKKRVANHSHGYPLILIAKDRKGYQNLCKLSSAAHLEGFYYTPRIDKEILSQCAEGLICLSGPLSGYLSSLIIKDEKKAILEEVEWFQQLFGENYFFEIQRHKMSDRDLKDDEMEKETWIYQRYLDSIQNQEKIIQTLVDLSAKKGIPCVATNDIHYLEREDWKAHEILMNIQSGEPCEIWEKDSLGNLKTRVINPKKETTISHELYFKSPKQMKELFSDVKGAIESSLAIANQCSLDLDFKTKYYPVFVPPHLEGKAMSKEERINETEKFLKELCEKGISKRYTKERLEKIKEKYPDLDPMEVVQKRLKQELEIITSKGMCDYLLIVYDFISWAKKEGIPMGPGRGSGAGSIILYLIEITDIEPLRFNLFFERFINPERLSYPDIDVDMCMERRADVIEYTVRKYGKDKIAQIITFGTIKAKMAIKDVGRVLSVPLSKVNEIAKLVPEDPNMTLEKALEIDPELLRLYKTDEDVRRIIEIGKKIEGSVRNTGIHAAGLIISGDPIVEHIPVCSPKDSDIVVTQFSMKPVEAVGMLKIDFLGLKTLTSIQKTVEAIKASRNIDVDWVNLPLDDEKTFDLLNQKRALGIFQMESGGMQDLMKQLHIDKFEEIIAVGALYRPGPMEMIPSFINRKHGKETIEIDHPLVGTILDETYGIMVYQEQVMQIASVVAGYSLGEGDVLRRAMGKKDKEEMSKQREKFCLGAIKKGVEEETAVRIFDKIEKFASYGFNKSHAAAYGYLTYVTAYLKAHYPVEWMSALMTCDRDDISKVAKIIRECQSMGMAILPPDINESNMEFLASLKGVRFAMTGIKGVGEGVVKAIIEERKNLGTFKSLYDFVRRIDTKKIGKKAIEHLIEAGCFDFTQTSRQMMIANLESIYAVALREQRDLSKGIMSFFSMVDVEEEKLSTSNLGLKEKKISKREQLKRENELLGFYLNGHPLDDFRDLLQRLSCVPLTEIGQLADQSVFRAAFIITSVVLKLTAKSQKKFAILNISDADERYELPIWPSLYEEKQHLITENRLLYAVLQLEKQGEEIKLQCRWLDDLEVADEAMIQACDLAYDRAKIQAKKTHFRVDSSISGKKGSHAMTKNNDIGKKYLIKLDADQIHFSDIIELKRIFQANSGGTPVDVEFFSLGNSIGTVSIATHMGIRLSKEVEKHLQGIKGVIPSMIQESDS